MQEYLYQYDPGIHIPAKSSCHVSRKRLKEMAGQYQITILQAEAGMGKTIFLTAAAHSFEGRCVWCDLEAADNSAAGFAALLEKAVCISEPGFSFGLGEVTDHLSVRDITFHIIGALNRLAGQPMLLVFDNAQEFNCSSASALFSALFKSISPNIRIMIATKSIFPVPLAMYQARGTVCVIDRNMLNFCSYEISELLYMMTGIRRQEELVNQIFAYTEGWPLAVMLILMRLQQLGQPVLGDPGIRDGRRALPLNQLLKDMQMYQYIASEVFGKMEQSLQQFLLTTSVLDTIEPSVCSYLTRQKNANQILEHLASHNLFVNRVSGEKDWYHYHSVLLDFLRDRISSEQRWSIQEKAARYYLSNHDYALGTAYAVKAGKPEILVRALENYGPEMLRSGQLELLGNWVSLITAAVPSGDLTELNARTCYMISRYYLYTGQDRETITYLADSCRLALEQKEKRFFSHYYYELDEDLEKTEQISRKRQILQVFMDAEVPAGDWMKDKYSRRLLRKWTEYCLCQNVHEQISAFHKHAMLIPVYRGSDMCLIHENIIRTIRQTLTGEELLDAAGSVRVYSEIISDFGYFTYICQAYRNRMPQLIPQAMEDMAASSEASCFQVMSRIYELLMQDEAGAADKEELRRELRRSYQLLQEQNLQLPFLRPEDRKKFFRIVNRSEEKKITSVSTSRAASCENPSGSAEAACAAEQDAPVLKVLCMDGMQVLDTDGNPVSWRTRKAKELFFRLFSMQGRSCDKQTLMEDLWPEGDREKVSALFDTTLSYLRKSLRAAGADQIILTAKRAYSLDMKYISSDLMELRALLTRYEAQEWLPSESPDTIRRLYRQGLLKGEDYLWASAEQEHMERRTINALTMLAGHFYMEGNYVSCIEAAHFALEINPFHESLVRLLIDGYVSDGQMGKAKKMQDYYNRLWLEELGEPLDAEGMIV